MSKYTNDGDKQQEQPYIKTMSMYLGYRTFTNKELPKLFFPGVAGMWKQGNTNYSLGYLPLRLTRFIVKIREESSGRGYGDRNLRNQP